MGKKKGKGRRGDITVENRQNGELPIQNFANSTEPQTPSDTSAVGSWFARTGPIQNDPNSNQQIREVNQLQLSNPDCDRGDPVNVEESSEHEVQAMSGGERFNVGDTIFESTPLVYVLYREQKDFRCDRCLFRRQTLVPCGKCLYVSYCSPICKKEAWKTLHKYECKKLKKFTKVTDFCRFIGLLIMVLKQPETSLIADQVKSCRITFEDLNNFEEKIFEEAVFVEFITNSYHDVRNYLGADLMVPFNEYKTIYAKASTALQGILTRDTDIIGLGLYLGSIVFQHSCVPTACYTFAGPILRVTCLEEIPRTSEKLVTINKAKEIASGETKRMLLGKKYTIKCICRRCMDPEFEKVTNEVLDATKASEMDHEAISHITGIPDDYSPKCNELNEIIRTCKTLLESMSGVYGTFHVTRAVVLSRFVKALFDGGPFDECEVWIHEYLAVCEFYFGPRDPRLATMLYLLVQTEIILGNRRSARSIMLVALHLTGICYGKDHPFYIHMISVYQHCEIMNWSMGVLIKSYPRYLDEF